MTLKFIRVVSAPQAVSSRSAFCLKIHEGFTHQFDFVIDQWKKDIGPRTHVILGKLSLFLEAADFKDIINSKDI